MKRKVLGYLALSLLFIIGVSGFAFGEVRKGAFTVSPMAGGYNFDKYEKDDVKLELDDWGTMFTLGIGYQFTKNLATELGFSYIHTDADLCKACNTDNDVYGYQPKIDLIYNIMPDSDFVPYVVMGVGGLFFDDGNLSPLKIDDTVQANGGIGFKYFFNDTMAIRADGRYYYGFEDSTSEYAITAGLVFQFGGEKKVEPCKDSDGDGVCDGVDRCANTPAGTEVDANGCPKVDPYAKMQKSKGADQAIEQSDKKPAKPEMLKVVVYFDFDKTDIKPEYFPDLEKLAEFMKKNPDTKGLIEGHTDSKGPANYNMTLSEKRARTVMKYLSDKYGIEKSRFEVKGYGESQPAATNKTAEGRAENRRVITITIMP
jgi:OOP family OmpA-OmpF porin